MNKYWLDKVSKVANILLEPHVNWKCASSSCCCYLLVLQILSGSAGKLEIFLQNYIRHRKMK